MYVPSVGARGGRQFDNECFVVSPIGPAGSAIRERADVVRDFIIKPAAARLGLDVLRADDIADPGNITDQVVEHVVGAKVVVADLTGRNPNVFYELAVRHSFDLPVVLVADEGETIPFDLVTERVIWLSLSGTEALVRRATTVDALERSMTAALDQTGRSPVSRVVQPAAVSDLHESTRESLDRFERQLNQIYNAVNGTAIRQELGSLNGEVRHLADLITSRELDMAGGSGLATEPPDVELESAVRLIVAEGVVTPWVQPILDLASRRWAGLEILLRGGTGVDLVPPHLLVPTAERLGLLPDLGSALAHHLITHLAPVAGDLKASIEGDLFVSLNASSREFVSRSYRQSLGTLREELERRGLSLKLEITESAIIGDYEQEALREVHGSGVGLVLDDFGTGYSSLLDLRRLEIGALKIDRSFIASVVESPVDTSIVRSIIELGHTLGMRVIAEGVETADQLAALASMDCDMVQGYLFGRPFRVDSLLTEFQASHPGA